MASQLASGAKSTFPVTAFTRFWGRAARQITLAGGNAVESMQWMVLHRPVELARLTRSWALSLPAAKTIWIPMHRFDVLQNLCGRKPETFHLLLAV